MHIVRRPHEDKCPQTCPVSDDEDEEDPPCTYCSAHSALVGVRQMLLENTNDQNLIESLDKVIKDMEYVVTFRINNSWQYEGLTCQCEE